VSARSEQKANKGWGKMLHPQSLILLFFVLSWVPGQINSRLQPEHLLSAAAQVPIPRAKSNDRAASNLHTYGILICRAKSPKESTKCCGNLSGNLRMRRCLVYTKLIKIRIYHVVPGQGKMVMQMGFGFGIGIGIEDWSWRPAMGWAPV